MVNDVEIKEIEKNVTNFVEADNDVDYFCIRRHKYLLTPANNFIEYNYNISMAIELIGMLNRKESREKSKNSNMHMGIKIVAMKSGATCSEIKSLRKTFRRVIHNKNNTLYKHRISYLTDSILKSMIELLEDNKNSDLISYFFQKHCNMMYRTILLGKQYAVIYNCCNKLSTNELEKEKKLHNLKINLEGITQTYQP